MKPAESEPMLLTGAPDIAAYLGVTIRQVRHWHEKKAIPSFKVRGSVCVETARLKDWLRERTTEAGR